MDNRISEIERQRATDPTSWTLFLQLLNLRARTMNAHESALNSLDIDELQLQSTRLDPTGQPLWLPYGINEFGRPEVKHRMTGMIMILVPGQISYTMGDDSGDRDERPPHFVVIDKPYLMGKYPITQAQWRTVMGNNPSTFSNEKAVNDEKLQGKDWDNHPVETVSWLDCQKFMKKAGLKLPPENAWEHACRAGTKERFHAPALSNPGVGGSDEEHLKRIAVFGRDYNDGHAEVGTKEPNDWGFHDMLGNVWEWCQDEYNRNYIGAPVDMRPWNATWDKLRGELQAEALERGLIKQDLVETLFGDGENTLTDDDVASIERDDVNTYNQALLTLIREKKLEVWRKDDWRLGNVKKGQVKTASVRAGTEVKPSSQEALSLGNSSSSANTSTLQEDLIDGPVHTQGQEVARSTNPLDAPTQASSSEAATSLCLPETSEGQEQDSQSASSENEGEASLTSAQDAEGEERSFLSQDGTTRPEGSPSSEGEKSSADVGEQDQQTGSDTGQSDSEEEDDDDLPPPTTPGGGGGGSRGPSPTQGGNSPGSSGPDNSSTPTGPETSASGRVNPDNPTLSEAGISGSIAASPSPTPDTDSMLEVAPTASVSDAEGDERFLSSSEEGNGDSPSLSLTSSDTTPTTPTPTTSSASGLGDLGGLDPLPSGSAAEVSRDTALPQVTLNIHDEVIAHPGMRLPSGLASGPVNLPPLPLGSSPVSATWDDLAEQSREETISGNGSLEPQSSEAEQEADPVPLGIPSSEGAVGENTQLNTNPDNQQGASTLASERVPSASEVADEPTFPLSVDGNGSTPSTLKASTTTQPRATSQTPSPLTTTSESEQEDDDAIPPPQQRSLPEESLSEKESCGTTPRQVLESSRNTTEHLRPYSTTENIGHVVSTAQERAGLNEYDPFSYSPEGSSEDLSTASSGGTTENATEAGVGQESPSRNQQEHQTTHERASELLGDDEMRPLTSQSSDPSASDTGTEMRTTPSSESAPAHTGETQDSASEQEDENSSDPSLSGTSLCAASPSQPSPISINTDTYQDSEEQTSTSTERSDTSQSDSMEVDEFGVPKEMATGSHPPTSSADSSCGAPDHPDALSEAAQTSSLTDANTQASGSGGDLPLVSGEGVTDHGDPSLSLAPVPSQSSQLSHQQTSAPEDSEDRAPFHSSEVGHRPMTASDHTHDSLPSATTSSTHSAQEQEDDPKRPFLRSEVGQQAVTSSGHTHDSTPATMTPSASSAQEQEDDQDPLFKGSRRQAKPSSMPPTASKITGSSCTTKLQDTLDSSTSYQEEETGKPLADSTSPADSITMTPTPTLDGESGPAPSFNQTSTVIGRLRCDQPNLSNPPREGERPFIGSSEARVGNLSGSPTETTPLTSEDHPGQATDAREGVEQAGSSDPTMRAEGLSAGPVSIGGSSTSLPTSEPISPTINAGEEPEQGDNRHPVFFPQSYVGGDTKRPTTMTDAQEIHRILEQGSTPVDSAQEADPNPLWDTPVNHSLTPGSSSSRPLQGV